MELNENDLVIILTNIFTGLFGQSGTVVKCVVPSPEEL
jgi:hypothetical protein